MKKEKRPQYRLPPNVAEWRQSRDGSPDDGSTSGPAEEAEFSLLFPCNE